MSTARAFAEIENNFGSWHFGCAAVLALTKKEARVADFAEPETEHHGSSI